MHRKLAPLWHPKTTRALQHFVDNPSHALILVGKAGSGKSFTATWLCKELLNKSNSPITPDELLTLSPDNKQIRIEQIREAQQFAKLKQSSPGVSRIIVIESADTMAEPAQNALLKLLEEPAHGVVLILLVEHETSLLPTVLSRSQAIKILPLTTKQIKEAFTDSDPLLLGRAAQLSRGYVGSLLTVLSDSNDQLAEAKQFLGNSPYMRAAGAEALSKDRDKAIALCENLVLICRAALESSLKKQQTSSVEWTRRYYASHQAYEQLVANANIKLVLDSLALKLI